MSNRFNNRNLLIVLGILLTLLLMTVIVKIPKEKSTLKDRIVDLDTADVYSIKISPKSSGGKPFEFVRENTKWSIKQESIVAVPRKDAIRSIFSEILSVKPQSLASVDKTKWKEFELTDSLATRISFFSKKGKNLADLMIGKFTYKQVSNPYSYGGNNIEGTSFVRLPDKKEIYAVDGFLAFSLGGNFNDWRDKSFLRCNIKDITRITFTFPSDSSYILQKKDSLWKVGEFMADSLITVKYFNSIGFIEGEDFQDGFQPVGSPLYAMTIEGNNLLNISVKCYPGQGKDKYIFNSSMNPDIYFLGTKSGMFDKLFMPSGYFTKKKK